MKLEEYNLPYWDKPKIKQSIDIGNRTIVILKTFSAYDMPTPREGIKNLVAFNKNDHTIYWVADLPSEIPVYQVYDMIRYNDNILKVYAGSMLCTIDIETGKILHEQFTY